MKLVIFNGKHTLDISHDIIYFDRNDLVDSNIVIEKIREFQPDLIIEEEKNDGVSNFTEIYKAFPGIPKAYWLIDGHCNLIDHIVYAKQFTFVFCAQSWFIPIVQHELLYKVFYLPLSHTQTLTEYKEMLSTPVERDIEMSFIGNIRSIHVERKKYIKRFLEIYPDFFAHQADYQKTLNYLRRSKTTFNCSLNNDLNFRVWEALACGAKIVTDEVTDVYSIYTLRKYLTLYDKLLPDWNNLEPPEYIDSEMFIKDGHTLTHRMLQLIDMCERSIQYNYV
jgi:hypothetical protein